MVTAAQVDQNQHVASAFAGEHLANLTRPKLRKSKPFEIFLGFAERFADLITVAIAIRFTSLIFPASNEHDFSHASMMGMGLLFVLMLDREGAYHAGNSLLRVKETERVLRVSAQLYFLMVGFTLFLEHFCSVRFISVAASLVVIGEITQKQLMYSGVRALHARGFGVRKIVIYGAGYTGRRVFSALARSPKLGLEPVAIVDDNMALSGERVYEPSYRRERSVPVMSGPVTKDLLQERAAGMLVIAIPLLDRDKFLGALNEATNAGIPVAFVPSNYVPSDLWIEHVDIDGLLLASFGGPSECSGYQVLKRIFDFVVGGVILVGLSPLLLMIALLIRLDSRGNAIFVQTRIGENGKSFDLFKFRTMHADSAAYEHSPKECRDSRITPIGRFLRRSSLDELPQLVNVIRGEMSLVGPRPEMPFIVEGYTPMQRQRLHVKPGLTGLWQISADRAFLIHENLEYDLYYMRNRGFFMDLAIVLHTFVFAMRGI